MVDIDRRELEAMRGYLEGLLENYPYLTKDEWFSPVPFGMYLVHYLLLDGVPPEKVPEPQEIFDLFFGVHQELESQGVKVELKHCYVEVPDENWNDQARNFFPDKKEILLHPASYVTIGPVWIWQIGARLMPHLVLPDEAFESQDARGPGVGWGRWAESLPMTAQFVQGFLDEVHRVRLYSESKAVERDGYSSSEVFYQSFYHGVSYEDAEKAVSLRGAAIRDAIAYAKRAHEAGFFVESTVLSECVISNILTEVLSEDVQDLPDDIFSLLDLMRKTGYVQTDEHEQTLSRLHFWRKRRNSAVHHVISSRLRDADRTMEDFVKQSEVTSEEGLELVEILVRWYWESLADLIRPTV